MNKLTNWGASLIKNAVMLTFLMAIVNYLGWISYNKEKVVRDYKKVKISVEEILNGNEPNPEKSLPRPEDSSQDHRHSIINHRLRHGETLNTLEEKYGINVEIIKRVNGIRDARRIRPGQVIRIPLNQREELIQLSKATY